MNTRKNFLINIEGIDGAGKGTQTQILYKTLLEMKYPAKFLSFPDYDTFFGKMVGKYLNGGYGTLSSVPVEFATLLYALNRWEFFRDLPAKNENEQPNLFVIDRYVPSNIAHQIAKVQQSERKDLFLWLNKLEHEVFGIPKPDIVLVLDVDPDSAANQVLQKNRRSYTDKKMDIHEENKSYLKKVREVFLELCNTEENYFLIDCNDEKGVKPIDFISAKIWKIVEENLKKHGISCRDAETLRE
ncbi:MAG: dTMP kinase [Candidatus Riflebacteria bacterium]|nr:dTMP kinase [Candidatus Riflebacteria bacterium]